MDWTGVLFALAPSVGIGVLFYKIMKALLEGDRKERLAHAQWDAAHADEVARVHEEAPADRGESVTSEAPSTPTDRAAR